MAGLPTEFPFQPKLDRAAIENLATLRFIDTHEDVLFTGKSGTGKSHILQALVLRACEREQLVRYTRCVDLIAAVHASCLRHPRSSWSSSRSSCSPSMFGGLGDTDRAYHSIDAHGVSLASIKALYRMAQEQQARLDRLEAENAELRAGVCR